MHFSDVVVAVHGGTGRPLSEMNPELDRQHRAGLEAALRAGFAALQQPQGTSLDAVEACVRVLEDDPLFNAGKGSVFTHDGRNELDAAIMEGRAKRAGSVAGLSTVRNPITAARAVMEKSPHVLLIGKGAEEFSAAQGIELVDPKYFWTEYRWQQLQRELAISQRLAESRAALAASPEKKQLGTVGAVAVDRAGNLAAGTSTGGMTDKQFGRVGDTPIIGAGTYADNASCAVSATGHGEFFIRYTVAHEIAALVKHKGWTVEQAAEDVVQKQLKTAGGEGGVIALDAQGRLAMSYNSEGMYRGYATRDGSVHVFLYDD